MYEVEKNILIPVKKTRNGDKSKFLSTLCLGDSFVFTEESEGEICNWYSYARVAKVKIATRKIDDNQYRIWVVEKDGVKLDE
tara:strand:- start:2 stop:247 length:246 start_codon:yes stop_codon:yes gene_type:complete